jgi:hypothetical protein
MTTTWNSFFNNMYVFVSIVLYLIFLSKRLIKVCEIHHQVEVCGTAKGVEVTTIVLALRPAKQLAKLAKQLAVTTRFPTVFPSGSISLLLENCQKEDSHHSRLSLFIQHKNLDRCRARDTPLISITLTYIVHAYSLVKSDHNRESQLGQVCC